MATFLFVTRLVTMLLTSALRDRSESCGKPSLSSNLARTIFKLVLSRSLSFSRSVIWRSSTFLGNDSAVPASCSTPSLTPSSSVSICGTSVSGTSDSDRLCGGISHVFFGGISDGLSGGIAHVLSGSICDGLSGGISGISDGVTAGFHRPYSFLTSGEVSESDSGLGGTGGSSTVFAEALSSVCAQALSSVPAPVHSCVRAFLQAGTGRFRIGAMSVRTPRAPVNTTGCQLWPKQFAMYSRKRGSGSGLSSFSGGPASCPLGS
mmetsp:Transcript_38888/g.82769  ORF Transcript_38888/g.82769 Transcript_38888/m.82769 type:complete len:263 (+) Transcript_38888:315-1103(+)|eukprot:CAMPEP_0180726134 /NCGR_PEP_ID=MMETSP1038_2-20121128/18399_1 /TAXON_ID=632150 /ORGANISM="Azadinium spinosum, Strain 3D9" /LENGTH=262 /DNA_ID=CAMNT_0022758757 /DNA_START=315 /DNA_END=1103 /DNA_ORIENTATION=+